jgi:DNA topoisomerase VI subunit B
MNRTQIESILVDKGFTTGQWLTFEYIFRYISTVSDKNIFVAPFSVQFYFKEEGDGDFFLIRYTNKTPLIYTGQSYDDSKYVVVPISGTQYLLRLDDGGHLDVDAGTFHDIVSFDAIVGFFKR